MSSNDDSERNEQPPKKNKAELGDAARFKCKLSSLESVDTVGNNIPYSLIRYVKTPQRHSQLKLQLMTNDNGTQNSMDGYGSDDRQSKSDHDHKRRMAGEEGNAQDGKT